MRKKIFILVFAFLFFALSFKSASAIDMAKGYTLPYPSTMPGSIAYKFHLVLIKLQQYWSFGSLTQFQYNLHESDEFLVQAKTLFEYDQHLLAYDALLQSDMYFAKAGQCLSAAKSEGKDISQSSVLFRQAAAKHIEVLTFLEEETPAVFVWSPEKAASSRLPIHDEIQRAIKIRQNNL